MLNDFLPAITSIAILAGAFLYAWVSDVRRIRRHRTPSSVIWMFKPHNHSFRKATIGSTPAARRAGITDASSPARPSNSVADVSIMGSHGFTPKS